MGALQDKRNRSLDSVWASNKEIIAVLEAMMGVTIGTDNGPLFIQDAGEKQQYRVYVDKLTGRMYYCIVANSDVTNSADKFQQLDITNLNQKILNNTWWDPYNYSAQNANSLVMPGEYQIMSENSGLRPGFCGSQCFVSVRNTGGRDPNGYITQIAYSYSGGSSTNADYMGGIAVRTRFGLEPGQANSLKWSPWRYVFNG